MSDEHPTDDSATADQSAQDKSAQDKSAQDKSAQDKSAQDQGVQDQGVPDQGSASPVGSSGAAVAHASRHENPTDQAESLGTGLGDHATGDIVIDSALQDLQGAPADDLDAQIDAGQRVQQTLQARLSDLGGE